MSITGSSRSQSPRENPERRLNGLADSTRDLLARAKGGDDTALDVICARYLPRLKLWAAGRLPVRARGIMDTGDLVQVTLTSTVARLPEIQARLPESFPAYLRTALLNNIRKEHRQLARQPEITRLDDSEMDRLPGPTEETSRRDISERYENALARLSERDQSVLFLRLEMSLAYRDIADELDMTTANAARMAAVRALARLVDEMESR